MEQQFTQLPTSACLGVADV